MRQTKQIVLDENTYIIQKMTPEMGCFWAFRLFGGVTNLSKEGLLEAIQNFTKMPKKDFHDFQQDCLGRIIVNFPTGPAPLVSPQGTLTVLDLSVAVVMELTIHSMMWTMADFFEAGLLSRLIANLPGMVSKPADPATPSQESTPSES